MWSKGVLSLFLTASFYLKCTSMFWVLPQEVIPTGCWSLGSPLGGRLRATIITEPWVVPTSRHGLTCGSVFLGKLSQKWKEEMASRDSLSMLVTLELRERVNELSLASEQDESEHKKWKMRQLFGKLTGFQMISFIKRNKAQMLFAHNPFFCHQFSSSSSPGQQYIFDTERLL